MKTIDVFKLIDPFEDRRIKQQNRARNLVKGAIKTGTLIKPSSCIRCNNVDIAIEGHHEDYTKPLEVVWLCRSCHRKAR